MIRNILRMGDPRLWTVAQPVEHFGTPELEALLVDMFETMHAANGAGLAAPQIGIPLRVVIFGSGDENYADEAERNPRYPDAPVIPRTVLINPQLQPLSEVMEEGWEGCLSVPGLRGSVPRYTQLRYTGFDAQGHAIDRTVDGFHARVVQHECDHLDGVLYPMRIKDFSKFGFSEEITRNI